MQELLVPYMNKELPVLIVSGMHLASGNYWVEFFAQQVVY